MKLEERLLHALSFGAVARDYAEHRPDYATTAVRWAVAPAPGSRVLDLGAGTGKLTAALVRLGFDVIAVEPDLAMLSELRFRMPDVHALSGTAEALPLPDGSVDVVLCGNALHWFNLDVAGSELARVLSPGGILAGLWNLLDDRINWVAELAQVSGNAVIGPRDTLSSWRAQATHTHFPNLGLLAQFGPPARAKFPHGQCRTADSLVATLSTRAGLLVMPERDRAAALDRITAFVASRPEIASGEFILPMVTGVMRTRRF